MVWVDIPDLILCYYTVHISIICNNASWISSISSFTSKLHGNRNRALLFSFFNIIFCLHQCFICTHNCLLYYWASHFSNTTISYFVILFDKNFFSFLSLSCLFKHLFVCNEFFGFGHCFSLICVVSFLLFPLCLCYHFISMDFIRYHFFWLLIYSYKMQLLFRNEITETKCFCFFCMCVWNAYLGWISVCIKLMSDMCYWIKSRLKYMKTGSSSNSIPKLLWMFFFFLCCFAFTFSQTKQYLIRMRKVKID